MFDWMVKKLKKLPDGAYYGERDPGEVVNEISSSHGRTLRRVRNGIARPEWRSQRASGDAFETLAQAK